MSGVHIWDSPVEGPMGSQVKSWSKTLAFSTHGARAVAVPNTEVPSWTSGGRSPLCVALASSVIGTEGAAMDILRRHAALPSITAPHLSLGRAGAELPGRLVRGYGMGWSNSLRRIRRLGRRPGGWSVIAR
ncbi:hypothetical protein CF319_g8111 [Tilletia indica]|nr:hypothetical protein CF319_g8111 [Tilletia indica]